MPATRRLENQSRRTSMAHGILVGVYAVHLQVQTALAKLTRSHVDLRQVCVVGTDYHSEESVYGYYSTGRSLEAWGSLGCFWKAVWAALTGGGFFFIPGLGPVAIGGPLAGWLVAALEKGTMVSGLSVLGAALVGKGVPPENMTEYEAAVHSDKFLLITSGPLSEMAKSRAAPRVHRGPRARPCVVDQGHRPKAGSGHTLSSSFEQGFGRRVRRSIADLRFCAYLPRVYCSALKRSCNARAASCALFSDWIDDRRRLLAWRHDSCR